MLCNFLLERTSCINFLASSRVSALPALGVDKSGPDLDGTAVLATGIAGAIMAVAGNGVGNIGFGRTVVGQDVGRL